MTYACKQLNEHLADPAGAVGLRTSLYSSGYQTMAAVAWPRKPCIYICWLAYVRRTGKPVVVIDRGIGFDASIEIKGDIFSSSVHPYTYLQEGGA